MLSLHNIPVGRYRQQRSQTFGHGLLKVDIKEEATVEGYMLSTGFGGNGVIEVPAATRDLAKLIMRDESTPLLENWAFERLLED